jgi:hypothetical protein
MKQSFLDHFDIISPALQPGLMAPECTDSLAKLCSMFPFDIAHDFGFEGRLGNPESICDFFLQIRKDSDGAKLLAGKSHITNLSDLLIQNPFWQKITKLFDAWTNSGTLLFETVEVFWLEFDHQNSSDNLTPNNLSSK